MEKMDKAVSAVVISKTDFSDKKFLGPIIQRNHYRIRYRTYSSLSCIRALPLACRWIFAKHWLKVALTRVLASTPRSSGRGGSHRHARAIAWA